MDNYKERALKDNFMQSLKTGFLKPVLDLVKNDQTLDLQIRYNKIDIYYRGGCLVNISPANNGFKMVSNENYMTSPDIKISANCLTKKIDKPDELNAWIEFIPQLKHEMDLHIGNNKKLEREFQQLVVRENNLDASGLETDYYIADIEYKTLGGTEGKEIDMIAVIWPSISKKRKEDSQCGLAFIEMKFGSKSLNNKQTGLAASLKYAEEMLKNEAKFALIKAEMLEIFNQKKELGLINVKKKLKAFSEEKPEFIFLLANYNLRSKSLRNELEIIEKNYDSNLFDIKFAVSAFMGYGLFRESITPLKEFKEKYIS
ncbi:MAG: hypothetical protein ACQES4_11505 [Bacillota bacterium]